MTRGNRERLASICDKIEKYKESITEILHKEEHEYLKMPFESRNSEIGVIHKSAIDQMEFTLVEIDEIIDSLLTAMEGV